MRFPSETDLIVYQEQCLLWKHNSHIIAGMAKPNSKQTYEDAVEIMDIILKMANGKMVGFLFDLTGIHTQDAEAREYYSSSKFDGRFFGIAIIVRSITARILANFFMGINKPKNPTKVFNDEESALNWLESLQ